MKQAFTRGAGATLALPGLVSYASYGTFQADGKGSVLDVSALTTLTQQGYWNIDATDGGEVKLLGMTSLTSTHGINITDTGGSTLLNDLASLNGVSVTLDGTDTQVANTWTQFVDSDVYVTGGVYSLPGLTDVDTSSLHISNGGSLALPGLTSYASYGTFQADGKGSVLDVSALTTLTQQGYWNIDATDGGEVKLLGMTSLTSTHGINITDAGGSTLLNDLASLNGVSVTLDGTDTQVANTWTQCVDSDVYVTGGVYSLPGLTDVDTSSLHISNGGSLALPGLTSYASYGTFQADGKGSVLDVSALTTLTQQGYWNIDATDGGEVKLLGMTSLTSTHGINITDTGGSTLLNDLASLNGVSVTLDGTDTQVANTWTQFVDSDVYVTGGVYSLPGLTDVDTSSLHISNGGSLALPGLTSYASYGTFQADGKGSVLDVSALTTLTQQGYWNIDATEGGEVKLLGMPSLTSTHGISITDTGGSTLLNDLASLTGVSVTLDGTDKQVANSWTQFIDGDLYVTGGVYSLPGLTDVDTTSLHISNGGSLALPGLTNYSSYGTFQADGAGSVLDVSDLTALTQQGYWNIDATNGGEVKLTGMTSLTSTHGINITDTGGSTLLNDLTSLTSVSVTLDGTDTQVANSWTQFIDGDLYVTGGVYSLPGLTDVDTTSLHISNGGSLALPGLTSYASYGTFQADGAGSVLDVSELTTLTQQGYWNIDATNGGEVILLGMTSLTSTHGINITDTGGSTLLNDLASLTGVTVTLDGTDRQGANTWTQFIDGDLYVTGGVYSLPGLTDVDTTSLHITNGGSLALPGLTNYTSYGTFQADGKGSVLDVSALTTLTQQGYWNIDATNGGEVKLLGITSLTSIHGINITDTGGSTLLNDLNSLTSVSVTLDGTDTQVANSWTQFIDGDLYVTGGVYSLPGLTDVDASNLTVQSGGSLSLPAVASYTGNSDTLEATGTGSLLALASLTSVTGTGGGTSVNVKALAGGTVQGAANVIVNHTSVTMSSQSTLEVGTLNLENSSTLGASGTLAANLINGGTVYPGGNGTAGQLTLTGSYTQTAAGTLALDLGGLTAGTQFDQLNVQGNATVGGTLSVALIHSYVPSVGNNFAVITAQSVSGAFGSATGLSIGHGVVLDPTVGSSGVTLNTEVAVGPKVVGSTPTGVVNNLADHVDVTFDEAIAGTSFTASEVSLTGPLGAIAVNTPSALSSTTFRISFTAQTTNGNYSISIGPGITDLAGNKMDQNGNGIDGEPGDVYTSTFQIALPDLAVTSISSPPSSAVEGASIPVSWTVTNVSTANPASGALD